MSKNPHGNLSRRERQMMDIIYQRGQASAAKVRENLPDPPSYSAVRATLRILEEKGYLKHKREGLRYVFTPTVPHAKASRSALAQLVQTFFNGSAERAVVALLDDSSSELSDVELDRLAQVIEQAKREGR